MFTFSVLPAAMFCSLPLPQPHVFSLQLHCRLPESRRQDFVSSPSSTMVNQEHKLSRNESSPQNQSPWFRQCWNLTEVSQRVLDGSQRDVVSLRLIMTVSQGQPQALRQHYQIGTHWVPPTGL